LKFNQKTEEEKRKLLMSIYFLYKGLHQLGRIQDKFSEKESNIEIKEAMIKRQNLSAAIARINDYYLGSEEEKENEQIQALEDEVFEWIEDTGFTEEVKKYFDKNSLMFR
jgi:Ser-tRNA(Ala) deacylase AlaX